MVAFGLRMIGQEQELAEKRLRDDRVRATSQLRQELSSRLERTALRETAALLNQPDRVVPSDFGSPEVALVARMVDGRIVLPWEGDGRPDQSRDLMGEAEFAHRVSQGEHEELVSGDVEQAVQHYRQALEVAHHPIQTAYAQLLLARALGQVGHDREALIHARAVLNSPPELVDEHGLPFALYAAVRLLQEDVDRQTVLACFERQMEDLRWPSPPALYLMRRILTTLSEDGSEAVAGEPREADSGAFPGDRVKDLEGQIPDLHVALL